MITYWELVDVFCWFGAYFGISIQMQNIKKRLHGVSVFFVCIKLNFKYIFLPQRKLRTRTAQSVHIIYRYNIKYMALSEVTLI